MRDNFTRIKEFGGTLEWNLHPFAYYTPNKGYKALEFQGI